MIDRYSRGTFQKTYSMSSSNHQTNAREKLYRKRFETNSLKLKIIQHCKQLSQNTPDSPEIFRTPNTTIDADDSAVEDFATPNGEFTLMKMKSMNNLADDFNAMHDGRLSRKKSLSQNGDTPVDLVKLKNDFESKRFNDAKMQSLTNLADGDEVDGVYNKRHHSDSSPPVNRHSLQTPKIFKRVGNTKYIGGDANYELMKMKSMGTINDILNNNVKESKNFDPFYNVNRGKKYDKTFVVPVRLDERFADSSGKSDKDDEVFKVPGNPMVPLRKEKSSSCIESMRNRGSSLYDRLR